MAPIRGTAYRVARAYPQDDGGILSPSVFDSVSLGDGADALDPMEDADLSHTTALVVSRLTRVMTGFNPCRAFETSWFGAENVDDVDRLRSLCTGIDGLTDESIRNAYALCAYDVAYYVDPSEYRELDPGDVDAHTVSNARMMVERTVAFLDRYGPRTLCGFPLRHACHGTNIVNAEGDIATADGLWGIRTSTEPLTPVDTLQMMIYWRLGLRSILDELHGIRALGFFNARTNTAYILPVQRIPADVVRRVDEEVIGFPDADVTS